MSWDSELRSLEAAIVRLNAEYDAFLYGSAVKPPLETRKQVDSVIGRLNRLEPESAADTYRFSTLQGRYNALCERWERLQAEKESGRRPGVYGGFVRESRRIAAEASRESPRSAPNASVSSSVKGGDAAVDPDADLYERYMAARQTRGEDVRGFDLPRFKQSLERERQKLRERFGSVDVEFEVAEREGRIKLVARRRSAVSPEGTTRGGSEGKR